MPELSPRRHLAAIWDDFGRLSAIEGSIFIDLITNVFDGTDFELVGGTRPAAFTIFVLHFRLNRDQDTDTETRPH